MLISILINYLMAIPGGPDDYDFDPQDTDGHRLCPGGPDDRGDDGLGNGPGNTGV